MRADSANPYIWRIVERFYRSRFHYLRIYERYEERVAGYVEQAGKPREKIRLLPRELSGLLSYKELEVLRDEYLDPLKDACHSLFRTRDSTEFLDRIVNDIFHELGILKEEHYNVLTYAAPTNDEDAPKSPEKSDTNGTKSGPALQREQEAVLDEVHDVFPQKVHRIHHLYEVAIGSLERLIGHYREDVVLIRSLFLHRDRFVARSYEKGLVRFYELMYGEDQIVEGYRTVGDSFYHSGFYDNATLAYDEGEIYLQGVPPNAKRHLDPGYKDTREHFRRQKKKATQHLEALEKGSTLSSRFDTPFADRLFGRVQELDSTLVVGIDPVLDRLPAEFSGRDPEDALVGFAEGVLDAVVDLAAAVKPQVAFFERFGWRGWRALERTCAAASERGIPVILDAKRGDIGSTATAYADALLGDAPDGLGRYVDALTLNAYLGSDSLEPFLARARDAGRGLFILARTSNPGGAEFQGYGPEGHPLYLEVARAAARWGESTVGASGYGSVGLVAGATFPEELAQIRAAAPHAPLLIPGVGAQGGDPADLTSGFDERGLGAVVNSSRGVIFAHQSQPEVEWGQAVRSAAAETRDRLRAALPRV